MSGEKMFRSAPGPSGHCSSRQYTQEEVAAAKRLGLARGRLSELGGPIFWATGDHYPNLIREQLADYKLVAAATEREWDATDANEIPARSAPPKPNEPTSETGV